MVRRTMLMLVMATAGVAACSDTGNDGIECVENANCDLDSTGRCVTTPNGRKFCAYGDGACASGFRYAERDVGDGLAGTCVAEDLPDGSVDAMAGDAGAADAAIDAGPTTSFDIAYSDEWKLNLNDLDIVGWLVIVNTGQVPINLNTFEVRAISDDHPTAAFSFIANPHDAVINPGFAAGWIFPNFGQIIFDSGLVTEPRVDDADENSNIVTMRMANAPVEMSDTSPFDINVQLTIGLAGLQKTIPILIHSLEWPVTWSDPVHAARVSVP